jgi:ornithine carbamoyltransferase
MQKTKRDFLTLLDISADELISLIDRSVVLKTRNNPAECPLIGKSIGIYFEKASTRTRIAFQTGIYELGANAIYLNPNELQLGRGETVEDTARVLSRYLHGFIMRTFSHGKLESFARNATIPVINGLTDLHHPCQALADLMTIREKKGRLKDVRVVYIGDGNNVANSLIEAALLTGIELIVSCPRGYEPDEKVYNNAVSHGAKVSIVADPVKAVEDADVVYTDVWVSMGQEEGAEKKKKAFRRYQVDKKLVSKAKPDAIIMHCLPAHRGEEITDEVIDSTQSVVLDQAENRLHTQKALLEMLIK